MTESLPWLCMAGAFIALVWAVMSLWKSFSALFGQDAELVEQISQEAQDRVGLLARKQQLLHQIKDLEFDRDLGKLSDADFQRLNRRLRERARRVMGALDRDIEAYRERALARLEADLPPGSVEDDVASSGGAQ